MSEKQTEEWYRGIRDANLRRIKELASLMNQVVDNPQVADEELEQIIGSLNLVNPHALDSAANGCGG